MHAITDNILKASHSFLESVGPLAFGDSSVLRPWRQTVADINLLNRRRSTPGREGSKRNLTFHSYRPPPRPGFRKVVFKSEAHPEQLCVGGDVGGGEMQPLFS